MKHLLLLGLLLLSYCAAAKTAKIYRCEQKDGTVVIQDRLCMITDLQKIKPVKSRKSQNNTTISPQRTTVRPKLHNSISQNNSNVSKQPSKRSPYFSFGWDRFIPANWLMKKVDTLTYDQTLLSRTQFSGLYDFKQGVKLSVYADTMKTSKINAFAQALVLYHQIRDNKNHQLLDSQFKAHPKYKVFNIKYKTSNKQLLLTEFYIDESNDDLFVVTTQSHESRWSSNWQLTEQIISHL